MKLNELTIIPVQLEEELEALSIRYINVFKQFKTFVNYNKSICIEEETLEYVNEEIPLSFIETDISVSFILNKISHLNFNFESFIYEDKCYIKSNAYQYADYCSQQFVNMFYEHKLQSYKDWSDQLYLSKKDKSIIHNYNCDKEDLFKIGISV